MVAMTAAAIAGVEAFVSHWRRVSGAELVALFKWDLGARKFCSENGSMKSEAAQEVDLGPIINCGNTVNVFVYNLQ
jgi:hypothetical protein